MMSLKTTESNGHGSVSLAEADPRLKLGLGVSQTAYLMVAQMAGAGFLALPRAIADAGWIGLVLMTLFCISVGFAAIRLASAWVLIEENYPQFKNAPVRQPYVEMSDIALGPIGRKITRVFITVGNMGSSTVYIILMSELLERIAPTSSSCQYTVIVALALAPLTLFGSPKDFWQVSAFAVFSTILTVLIIVVKIVLDFGPGSGENTPPATHPNPTIVSFSLGFGATLFSFGGVPVFPTIQNDMKVRADFWKSAVIGFVVIYCLYLPVALLGYLYIGDAVKSDILITLPKDAAITVAIVFQIFNLMGTYIITLSPVFLCFEDMLNIPSNFGIKRVFLRTGVVLLEMIVALSFPDFGLVVNLIGGSTLATLCFILPTLICTKLNAKMNDEDWKVKKSLPTWQKFYMWEILMVGFVGGICATVTSLFNLLSPEQLDQSCFIKFFS